MQGRTALAAALVSAALNGCGQEADVAPERIEITNAPPHAAASAPAAPIEATRGRIQIGARTTGPLLKPPAAAPSALAAEAPVRLARTRPSRFREEQLQVLRAHCATRPPDDPRCDGDRVDEQVALGPFEEGR